MTLRDMFVMDDTAAYPTLELLQLPRWLEPAGPIADRHIDVAVTTATYRLIRAAMRIRKEAELEWSAAREREGQLLIEDLVWRHMVEHMEFAALDPRPQRLVPHLVYKSLLVTHAQIGPQARTMTLDEAQLAADGLVLCYCCGDQLWSPAFETPLQDIPLDHLWPRTLGGVSTADNLLPICDACNGAKQDRASWSAYGPVFDHALVERGGEDGLPLLALALHRRAVGALAARDYLTLKEAFIAIGSRTEIELVDERADRHFFNYRAHDAAKFIFSE